MILLSQPKDVHVLVESQIPATYVDIISAAFTFSDSTPNPAVSLVWSFLDENYKEIGRDAMTINSMDAVALTAAVRQATEHEILMFLAAQGKIPPL